MTITIEGEPLAVLKGLAQSSGSDSIFEELRSAISMRKFFTDKVDEGYRIILEDPEVLGVRTLVDYR